MLSTTAATCSAVIQVFFQINLIFFRHNPVDLLERVLDLFIQFPVVITDGLVPYERILIGVSLNLCAIQKVILKLDIVFLNQEFDHFEDHILDDVFHLKAKAIDGTKIRLISTGNPHEINIFTKSFCNHVGGKFFGGTTRSLTPDNLKVGILSNRKYENPVINQSYQELTDHYRTALLPARVLVPRDKAAVEGSVGNLTFHIIARLRNRKFFDIHTMNTAIRKELERFNEAPFQKKDGSRHSVFLEEELPFLQPLPRYPYEFAQWKSATVQMNYHIAVDLQNYSVPYEYVRKKVDVRYTRSSIEVYYKGNRICSHKRLQGRRGQYFTIPEHMPVNHQLYSEWDKERFLKWASGIGEATRQVVLRIFDSYRIEEQAYKSCLSLLKLADKYTPEQLEHAYRAALERIPSPHYKNIRLILESGNDRANSSNQSSAASQDENYALVRGTSYYGGGSHEN